MPSPPPLIADLENNMEYWGSKYSQFLVLTCIEFESSWAKPLEHTLRVVLGRHILHPAHIVLAIALKHILATISIVEIDPRQVSLLYRLRELLQGSDPRFHLGISKFLLLSGLYHNYCHEQKAISGLILDTHDITASRL